MFDADGDGLISKQELQQVFFGGAADELMDFEKVWNEVCRGADTDNDGKLSYDEFEGVMLEVIQQKDSFFIKST